jgi:hypothetical protein
VRTVNPGSYQGAVLRALCLSGRSDLAGVVRRCGFSGGVVHGELLAAEAAGLVAECAATGQWHVTPIGSIVNATVAASELTDGARRKMHELQPRLKDLDTGLAALRARWFLREVAARGESMLVPNDHHDPLYDAAVLDDIRHTHPDRLSAMYAAVVLEPRLERYAGRLADAWRRVRRGDHAALGDADRDAYFDVWAEFVRDVAALAGDGTARGSSRALGQGRALPGPGAHGGPTPILPERWPVFSSPEPRPARTTM